MWGWEPSVALWPKCLYSTYSEYYNFHYLFMVYMYSSLIICVWYFCTICCWVKAYNVVVHWSDSLPATRLNCWRLWRTVLKDTPNQSNRQVDYLYLTLYCVQTKDVQNCCLTVLQVGIWQSLLWCGWYVSLWTQWSFLEIITLWFHGFYAVLRSQKDNYKYRPIL